MANAYEQERQYKLVSARQYVFCNLLNLGTEKATVDITPVTFPAKLLWDSIF
jgi:hypothetical protein